MQKQPRDAAAPKLRALAKPPLFSSFRPLLRAPLRLWFFIALVVVLSGFFMIAINIARPLGAGDAGEYFTQIEALRRHGTPDLRAGDAEAVTAMAKRNGYSNPLPHIGFFRSPRDGRMYSWHFWGFSLAALPMRFLLDLGGINSMLSFTMFNALLFFATFLAALGVALKTASPRALALWSLCAGTPVLWYLRWPTPEIWTWAGFFGALLCLDARRYAWGALLAALAAWQNPPALFLAWWFVSLAVVDERRRIPDERRWQNIVPVFGAALLCFLPNFFYQTFFGVSNLIFSTAYKLDLSLVSLPRAASFLFDLNQGMLPYVPITMALCVWSFARALRLRDGRTLVGFLVLAAMIAACCLNAHWNVGEAGMRRYAAWMMPLWAWLALRNFDFERARTGIFAAILWQMAIFASHDGSNFFRGHTPWARWTLVNAPRFYNPDPIIFVERSPKEGIAAPDAAPVAILDADGNVTKLLLSRASINRLDREFYVDARWLQTQNLAFAQNSTVLYVHPPRGAVRARPETRKKYENWANAQEVW